MAAAAGSTAGSGGTPIPSNPGSFFRVALQWMRVAGEDDLDLDLQACVFDEAGHLMDAAFYNQLEAVEGAVVHSGDPGSSGGAAGAQGGSTGGEFITVDLARLPRTARVVSIVVAAHLTGSFEGVETAQVDLATQMGIAAPSPISSLALGSLGSATCALVGCLFIDASGGWVWKQHEAPLPGRNFRDALEKLRAIGVDPHIDQVMLWERSLAGDKTFQMHKGQRARLPPDATSLTVGLGWTTSRPVDLDAACSMLSAKGQSDGSLKVVDVVWHNDVQAPGVKHSGDNLDGEGDGFDETISVDLTQVPQDVQQLVFTVNCHTGSLEDVTQAFVALMRGTERLAQFQLEGQKDTSVVFCTLQRLPGGGWGFEATGHSCPGRTAKDSEVVDCILGRPIRVVPQLRVGQSMLLPPTLYDEPSDTLTIYDEWGCKGSFLWLDASLLLLAQDGERLATLDFSNKKAFGGVFVHSGDQQDETGKKGHHSITIRMQAIPEKVTCMALTMSAYTGCLADVQKPFISLQDNDGRELARFLPEGMTTTDATCCTMVTVHRTGAAWTLTAHGFLSKGNASDYSPVHKVIKALQPMVVASSVHNPLQGGPQLGIKDSHIDYAALRSKAGQPTPKQIVKPASSSGGAASTSGAASSEASGGCCIVQ